MTLRLGTRGSPLALVQANMVRDALLAAHGWDEDRVEIVAISTRGDRDRTRPLTEMGGKAVWTKELDRALLAEETDASVHSMKDVESKRPQGLGIAAMLPRADVRDRLIGAERLADLPEGAMIGTASPRRAAQVRRLRPDLRTGLLRGNVATRIEAVEAGHVDATLLASAGLLRLGLDVGAPVPVEQMLPAPAQGAIGIDARSADDATRDALAAIDDAYCHAAVAIERAFVTALDGDCHSPVAAYATWDGEAMHLRAALYSEAGDEAVEEELTDARAEAVAALAHQMLDRAPPSIQRLFR